MNKSPLIPVERKDGVTLYGRVINPITQQIGQYEVHRGKPRNKASIYPNIIDGQRAMKAMIGVYSTNK